jgi:ubiquinone/menaquinone biosynthesis C-methylase UbiE
MSDVYADITAADLPTLEALINGMEVRAADPRQVAIRQALFDAAVLPDGSRVIEIGCGSGAICRDLAQRPEVDNVTGLDPSPVFLGRARQLAKELTNVAFDEGDGRSLNYADGSFDVVMFHTCLSHVPGPEKALAEAFRVLRSGGRLVILEGDYATTTVAISPDDPLQACVEAAVSRLVHDRWLVRRLAREVSAVGFELRLLDSYGYLQTRQPDYMMTLVTRGADFLAAAGKIALSTAEALKAEARERVAADAFFGFIGYAGLAATRLG